ncbi:MAG: ferritin [Chloroflexaceae bacterium]|nr:ferritin [Chloroflexaceae bacterium]
MNQTIQDAINEQIKLELMASHAYLAMSIYCEEANLPGCAHWMRLQSEEERAHALKLIDFMNDRGARVILQGLPQPQIEFESPLDVFTKTLEHERKVTASIHRIYQLSQKEYDPSTQVLMQWYINEQVEEEKNASDVIAMLQMAGGSGVGLLMVDRELAGRTGEVEEE